MTIVDSTLVETCTAPTNIAVIKYWGKDNVKLNTPLNSSFSVTLEQDDLHTVTTVVASTSFPKDRFWLNGKEIEINSRGTTVISEIRKLANDRVDATNKVIVRKDEWSKYKLHICSINTFPTGAGLASSAAGLACLVATLARLFCVVETYPGELSAIARQGSGSASRSMYGGFVRWQKGSRADGSDSIAIQLADHKHWPDLRAVIMVVSDKEKDTSSTSGMETSKATSPLLKFRAENVVQPRLEQLESAVLRRDFETFGALTMQDSNQFHATCLDTYAPIFYMNDVSKAIIRLVHVLNKDAGKIIAAYTFDAGPNAVIYTLEQYQTLVAAVMLRYFPAPGALKEYCNKPDLLQSMQLTANLSPALLSKLDATGRQCTAGDVKYVFLTRAGPGPIPQSLSESLIDLETGLPGPVSSKHKRLEIAAAKDHSLSLVRFTGSSLLFVGLVMGVCFGFALTRSKRA